MGGTWWQRSNGFARQPARDHNWGRGILSDLPWPCPSGAGYRLSTSGPPPARFARLDRTCWRPRGPRRPRVDAEARPTHVRHRAVNPVTDSPDGLYGVERLGLATLLAVACLWTVAGEMTRARAFRWDLVGGVVSPRQQPLGQRRVTEQSDVILHT